MAHLIPFLEDYLYPSNIKLLETPSGHFYEVNGETLPSVTTILRATDERGYQLTWGRYTDAETQEAVRARAARIGTTMHSTIEAVLRGTPIAPPQDLHEVRAHHMAYRLVEGAILGRVTGIYAMEQALYSHGRYAGTADLIAVHDRRLTIIDFKSAGGIPPPLWIKDYFLQLAAYAIAHDEMQGTRTDHGAIMLASKRSNDIQVYRTAGRDFDNYKDHWKRRVDEYYRLQELAKKDAPPAMGAGEA